MDIYAFIKILLQYSREYLIFCVFAGCSRDHPCLHLDTPTVQSEYLIFVCLQFTAVDIHAFIKFILQYSRSP